MPIPMTPGGDGAAPAVPASPTEPVRPPVQAAQTAARPPLATALPTWDLVPPNHVLAFRRRA
jgi:hypothetical protein